jgi:hypothetical protein
LALKSTIEGAVVELIKEGERKGVWDYRTTIDPVTPNPTASGDATIPLGMSRHSDTPADQAAKMGAVK